MKVKTFKEFAAEAQHSMKSIYIPCLNANIEKNRAKIDWHNEIENAYLHYLKLNSYDEKN